MASMLDSSWNCYDTDGLYVSPTHVEARTAAPPIDPDVDMRPISGPLPKRKITPAYDKAPKILAMDGETCFYDKFDEERRRHNSKGKAAATIRDKEASSSTTTTRDNDFHTLTYEALLRSQKAGDVSEITNHVRNNRRPPF
jgi:hypothetical protein